MFAHVMRVFEKYSGVLVWHSLELVTNSCVMLLDPFGVYSILIYCNTDPAQALIWVVFNVDK